MKKKILFIITYLELGGAQKQLLSLIENLDRDKYSLYLCAGDDGCLKSKFKAVAFLKVYFVPELVRRISPLNDLIVFLKLYFFIRKNGFDIVHTHSPKASILGRWAAYLAGVRSIIYTAHGWPFHDQLNQLLAKLYFFLEKVTALITKRIIVVSASDLRKALKNRVSLADRFVLIHYGIDIQWAENIFLKRKTSPPADNLIVNISCLKPQKGLRYFLDAVETILRKRGDARFSLIGDGPLYENIKQEIEERKLEKEVVLEGWKDNIAESLSSASVMVIASLWEGLPLAVIEAVISGVPVVATDTGGVLDIIKDKNNGIILHRKDAQSIADAIISIMDNYKSWHKKVIAAREHLDLAYWSDKRMTELTEKTYQEVLSL